MKRLFPMRQHVKDPDVIISRKSAKSRVVNVGVQSLEGRHYRISPSTADEVFALVFLEHQVDKFAPAHGDGVIVTEKALTIFDS